MSGSGADNLVFLDESGVNNDMTRHYARGKTDERAAYTVYQGGTTTERFAEYLKEALLPSLTSVVIIIMDNMRSHHAKAVKQVLDASGIRYLYLPPYSPDFNPIEKCGRSLRHICEKQKSVLCRDFQTQLRLPFQQLLPPIDWAGFVLAAMCRNLVDCYSCNQSSNDN